MSDSARPTSRPPDSFPEKRTFQRYALWFPVTLTTRDTNAEVWAICRDASAGGIQISSQTPVAVGTKVSARFRISRRDTKERAIDASIVRSETNDGELMLAFPFRLGLRFTSPVPELPEELADQVGIADALAEAKGVNAP
jgi:hypothetical protein